MQSFTAVILQFSMTPLLRSSFLNGDKFVIFPSLSEPKGAKSYQTVGCL